MATAGNPAHQQRSSPASTPHLKRMPQRGQVRSPEGSGFGWQGIEHLVSLDFDLEVTGAVRFFAQVRSTAGLAAEDLPTMVF